MNVNNPDDVQRFRRRVLDRLTAKLGEHDLTFGALNDYCEKYGDEKIVQTLGNLLSNKVSMKSLCAALSACISSVIGLNPKDSSRGDVLVEDLDLVSEKQWEALEAENKRELIRSISDSIQRIDFIPAITVQRGLKGLINDKPCRQSLLLFRMWKERGMVLQS